MNADRRLVVVGGDAAGMSAASQARRVLSPEQLQILAFERSPHTSYSACGLPYYAGGVVDDAASLVSRTPEEFRESYGIEAHIRHEVTSIELSERRVTVTDLETEHERREAFDLLLIATGTEPIRPEIEGIESEGIFGLSTLQSGIDLRGVLDEGRARKAVVVGGGYIGLEMAEAFRSRGLDSTLVELAGQPMRVLDADIGALAADALRDAGVEVHLGEEVVAFENSNGKLTGVVTTERSLPADIVALGLGTKPNVSLAEEAGLRIGQSGAIWVDDHMRTSHGGIFAAGDCAEQIHRITGEPVNFHLGTIANKMGRIAGRVIAGKEASFPGVIGTATVKVCDLELGRTGLSSDEAMGAGYDFEAVMISSETKSGYYPGAAPMWVKLIADKRNGRILGCQIAGGEGSAKRIDVMAMAIWNEITVDELVNVDLSYAPPFSTVWDPVQVAARKLIET